MNFFNKPLDIEKILEGYSSDSFNRTLWEPLNRKDIIFTLYGRNALYLGLKGLLDLTSKKKILVPSYSCGDELNAIISAGFVVEPYRVRTNFESDIEDIIRKIDGDTAALFITHFFGIPQNNIKLMVELCHKKSIFLIEDCAHCCGGRFEGNPLGTFGDFSIFSLRKSFDIPHGGALVINNDKFRKLNTLKPSSEVVNLDIFVFEGYRNGYIHPGSSIGSIIESTTDIGNIHGSRHSKCGGYNLGISNFAKILMGGWVKKNDGEHRRSTFNYYLDFFLKNGTLSFQPAITKINKQTVPLFFPLKVENSEKLCDTLKQRGIVITQPFWSHMHSLIDFNLFLEAKLLKEQIIILPLNNQVPPNELTRLIEI